MTLIAGRRLGAYEIVAPIGAGGMGEVYRAHDTQLGRDVAIKVLPESFAHDAERMARFQREAQVLASLNHPNIATIHGLEESDGVRALVMELVEGPTLAERIGGHAIPLGDALPIAKQIAEGLEYAHERGIIHRDLKPANVKLTADGNVKILDFGLAKALETPTPPGNPSISPTLTLEGTRAGVILGTAAYMAPEQARGAVVDKRADIWAFGVVLYEMLTGKEPFAGSTVSDTLAAVLRTEPEWEVVPIPMRRLVRQCLEKDAKRRLRDIGDLRLILEEKADIALAPRTPSALLWKVLAAALALALILAFLWRSPRPISQAPIRFNLELPEFTTTGYGAGAILSPDGARLVYTGRGSDGKIRLFARPLDREQATPMTGTEGAYGPFFSPDGQFIGFFAGGKLKKTSVQGGGTVTLCDAPAGRGATWGANGEIIAALNFSGGLFGVSSEGGMPRSVTELRPEKKDLLHRWPQMLPGDQVVLFTAHATAGAFDDARIEAQSLRTGERKMLVRGGYYGRYVPSGHLLYLRQGTLYAVPMDVSRLVLTGPAEQIVEEVASSGGNGGAQLDFSNGGMLAYIHGKAAKQTLMWLDSMGRLQPVRATANFRSASLERMAGDSPRFSPNGHRLAFSRTEGGNSDGLWAYEWERDVMTRLTFTPGDDYYPVWSPDGNHIVIGSTRHGGARNLYWMRADGVGEAVRLTKSNNLQIPFSFSPDGKRLAFQEAGQETGVDLWTVLFENQASDDPKPGKPEPLLTTAFNEEWPMISPDGRWLAYVSDESGTNEVYVRQFSGKGKWGISAQGGDRPVWSRNRHELFYRSAEGLMIVTYSAGAEMFMPGKPQLWTEKKDLGLFDLAPDGRFVIVQSESSAAVQKPMTQVTFLLNFFDELRRRAPAGGK